MREIKFEVIVFGNDKEFITKFNEWLDGDGWQHNFYPVISNGTFNQMELGDGYLGSLVRRQFTGLRDKNGVDIYEGDVLEWLCSKSCSNKMTMQKVVIDWNKNGYGYELTIYSSDGKWATGRSQWNKENRTILGNIYEHPTLIS